MNKAGDDDSGSEMYGLEFFANFHVAGSRYNLSRYTSFTDSVSVAGGGRAKNLDRGCFRLPTHDGLEKLPNTVWLSGGLIFFLSSTGSLWIPTLLAKGLPASRITTSRWINLRDSQAIHRSFLLQARCCGYSCVTS